MHDCQGSESPSRPKLNLESTLTQYQTQQQRDPSIRKRLHQLMSENFQLKEEVSSLQTQLRVSLQIQQEIKEKLKCALQEITSSDELIEKCRFLEEELKTKASDLMSELELVKKELKDERGAVTRLVQHNNNLESEACLVSELKQKYQLDFTRIKLELDQSRIQIAKLEGDKQELTEQLSRSLTQVEDLRHELGIRRGQMEQYESYVLQRVTAAQNGPQIHEKCVEQRDKWYCKYLKYKERSRLYCEERDQLLKHLSALNRQVGSNSLRSYLNE